MKADRSNAWNCGDDLVRAFVAAIPPEDVLDSMAAFVARLRPLAPFKWVGRGQLHLTLRFLGEAPAVQVEAVSAALEKIDAGKAFDIRLDRAGGFPNLNRPRALWMGGEAGAKELAALAARAEKAAIEAGYPAETKRFSPHLTLARPRTEGTIPPDLAAALESVPVFSWRCDRFFLIRSRLTPAGPVYTVLREYPLG